MDEIFGIRTLDILTAAAGGAAFIVIFAIWNTLIVRDPMRSRVKALQERREALRAGLIAPKKRGTPLRSQEGLDFMKSVVARFKLAQSQQAKNIQVKLVQAGFRSKDAITVYLFTKLVSPILFGVIGLLWAYGANPFPDKPFSQPAISIAGVLFGFYAPELFLRNITDKRISSIRKALPDALDLMVICAEAGLTLDSSLARVSKEIAKSSVELADELQLTSIELGFLTDRKTALHNLSERVNLKAVRGVVTTLVQTERYGTPLAQSLRVLSAEFRNERMMRAEEKAARLPALMTVPLILFILPCLFIVLMGPATCRLVDALSKTGK